LTLLFNHSFHFTLLYIIILLIIYNILLNKGGKWDAL